MNQHGFDSEVTVYTGASLGALSFVAGNDDANATLQSEVEFDAVAGTTYHIQVDGYRFDYGGFQISYGVNRPTNDDFANAQVLSGTASGWMFGINTRATGEAGEPGPSYAASSSVWFSWTAPESGLARFTTAGSDFDTVLAVYTGSGVGGLTLVSANDNVNASGQSMTDFSATAGTTYRIQVAGPFIGDRGNLRLQFSVNPQGNDTFSTPILLPFGSSGTTLGSNSRAVGEPGEPTFAAGNPADTSVWYVWTPPSTGNYRFTTAGSSFDTVLTSATGNVITALTPIAVNDDADGTWQSRIEFTATAGTIYYLHVDG